MYPLSTVTEKKETCKTFLRDSNVAEKSERKTLAQRRRFPGRPCVRAFGVRAAAQTAIFRYISSSHGFRSLGVNEIGPFCVFLRISVRRRGEWDVG